MKNLNKLVLIGIMLFSSQRLFCESLKFSDLTPIIDDNKIKPGPDALPDFRDLIEIPHGSGNLEPELPDFNIEEENILNNNNKDSEKNLFSEILVGGGYPFLFHGDCSIFSVNELNPFKFNLNFDTVNGYYGKSFNENFTDMTVDLSISQSFKIDNLLLDFSTTYDFALNGFQNMAPGLSVNNQHSFTGTGKIFYSFPMKLNFGGEFKFDFYSRAAGVAIENDFENWVKKSNILNINPVFYGFWENNGFKVGIISDYYLQYNIFNDIKGGNNHRGEIKTGIQWTNDIITGVGNLSLVFSNNIKSGQFLVPFNLGINFNIPVSFANRRVKISLEGGLDSYENYVQTLEKKYKFSGLGEFPSESVDWFCKFNLDIPVKTYFTGNVGLEYRETAFNNGIWEPEFSDKYFVNGLYKFNQKNHRILTTDFAITYTYKFFSIMGGWHSNWLNVPVLESIQSVNFKMSFQDEKARWGTSISGIYNVDENWSLPIINIDAFAQLTPKVRLTASVEDCISIFYSSSRKYAGKYMTRGFSAGIFLKFVL